MRKYLLSGVFVACALMGAARASADEFPRYTITANVDTHAKTLTATAEVTFTNNSSLSVNELYFHVYPNRLYTQKEKDFMMRFIGYFKVNPFPEGFDSGAMRIREIIVNGQPVTHSIEGDDKTLLKIPLSAHLAQGQSVNVTIAFDVDIPHAYGRFGWYENMFRLSRWYPLLSVHNDQGWHNYPFYPFHRPFYSDAAYYDVKLTVPQRETVIHSGIRVEETPADGASKTLTISSKQPIRDFTFAFGPDYKVVEDTLDGVTIRSFYLPGDEKKARLALTDAKDLMAYFTQRFGAAYPYEQFNIAPVHLGYGGEQMANLIFIDTRVYRLPGLLDRYFDFLIAHEAGHQWIYNVVGVDEYTQMWLEEGLNSYLIMGYLENKYGANASVLNWPEWARRGRPLLPDLTFRRIRDFRYQLLSRAGYDRPVLGDLASFQEPSSIFSIAYGKGSRIFAMVEHYLGKEKFDNVLRRILSEYAFKNIHVDEFVKLCESEGQQDMAWFFNKWLDTANQFDYAVNGVKGNVITVENRGDITMPVDVRVEFADGTSRSLTWEGKGTRVEAITLDTNTPIKRVQLDPGQQLLDIDRTNNNWPRIVRFKPVPLYIPLYDLPVFLPDDSYNVVFGPEIHDGIGFKASVQKPYDQIFYAGTDYEFGEAIHHSRVGYQINNVLNTQTAAGFEISNRNDLDDGDEDLVSGKVFVRRELWPAAYGLTAINDHATLYLLRNHSLNEAAPLTPEDASGIDYSRREESIVGASLHLNRSGPYPDPARGYKLNTVIENAGHFLGGTQYFQRQSVDLSVYQPVTPKTRVAARAKFGLGYPDDKELFYLGGIDGLRGYDRKSVRGANGLLGSLEYRFPIRENLKWAFLDNLIGLESIGAVIFADAGHSWFSDFNEGKLRKDAGAGLRFTVNIGSMLEKVVVRFDAAQAINEDNEDTHFWFGLNHAF